MSNDLEIFTRHDKEEVELLDNPFYMDTVSAVIPIIQLDIDKAFKPVLWNDLIDRIDTCIQEDQFVEPSSEDPSTYLFGMVAKFSPGDKDVLHIARLAMAFKKNEEGEVTSRGQLLLDVTVQSTGRTTHSEMKKFGTEEMLEKYRLKGDSVIDKISKSLIDVRSMDTVFKHLLIPIQKFVVRVDGEETDHPLFMLNRDKVPVVSFAKMKSKTSNCAAYFGSSFEARSEGALLTSKVTGTCTTSSNDPSGNIQNLHTTVNVQHVLSADTGE